MTFLTFPVDFFSGACHYETVWLVNLSHRPLRHKALHRPLSQQWYPYFWCIFRGWLPPRKHRYNIGRYIGQYIQYWTITKWTNGQNLGLYITKITKIGNIEDLRGHNVNVGQNNDIYGNITLSLLVGNFVRSIKGNWHFRWKFHLLKKRPCKYGIWNRVFKRV